MPKFIATHGVQFADIDIAFKYDREATGNKSTRVYSADLDAKAASALTKLPKEVLAEYGIQKASSDDDA